MAAFGEASENPVGINVTAMVDVLLCLCLFYLCILQSQSNPERIETWLPRDGRGCVLEEIRVFVKWDPSTGEVFRKVGNRAPAADDDELMTTILRMTEDYTKAGRSADPIVDATESVPWEAVVHLVDLCKLHGIWRIQFAAPYEYRPK